MRTPDNVFISDLKAIDAGVIFYSERLRAEREWEEWSRGDLKSLLTYKKTNASGLQNLDLRDLTDPGLFSICSDYYSHLMCSSMPVFTNAENEDWYIKNKKHLHQVIRRAANQWAIYGRAVISMVGGRLQALDSFNCVPITLPYDRNQIQGYVILQPMPKYSHPQTEILKDSLMENFVRVTRYLPNGYTSMNSAGMIIHNPNPIKEAAIYKYAGRGGTGTLINNISGWQPSEIDGVWFTEPIAPFYPQMADTAFDYAKLLTLSTSLLMRYAEGIFVFPDQQSNKEQKQLYMPGGKVITYQPNADVAGIKHILYNAPKLLEDYPKHLREQSLAAASLNEAALGITGVLQESGVSRRMQMTDALARVEIGREGFSEFLPEIAVYLGAKTKPEVRWEGTPLETVDARIRASTELYEKGIATLNEVRNYISLERREDGEGFSPILTRGSDNGNRESSKL